MKKTLSFFIKFDDKINKFKLKSDVNSGVVKPFLIDYINNINMIVSLQNILLNSEGKFAILNVTANPRYINKDILSQPYGVNFFQIGEKRFNFIETNAELIGYLDYNLGSSNDVKLGLVDHSGSVSQEVFKAPWALEKMFSKAEHCFVKDNYCTWILSTVISQHMNLVEIPIDLSISPNLLVSLRKIMAK
jgi:hypothetical protein